MRSEASELWDRVAAFQLDDPQSSLTFTQRLARENGWLIGYADRVVEEYRRFLYLAATSTHEVTPSDQVDQAWHLHLTYSRSYWKELCANVLKMPLHHGPTRGSSSDSQRYRAQYGQTLVDYCAAFGVSPPTDIWPPASDRFDSSRRCIRVDRSRCWIIPKPWAVLRPVRMHKAREVALGLAPLTLLAMVNPMDMQGPEFLAFYGALLAIAVVAGLVLRTVLRPGENAASQPLDAYQIACLSGGTNGAIQAAVASLLRRRAIRIAQANTASQDYRLIVRGGTPPDANELEQRIVAACGDSGHNRFADVARYAVPAAEKIQHRLEAWGLLVPSEGVHASRWLPAALILSVMAVGVAKVFVGIQRGRPVGFLVLLLFLSVAIFCLLLVRPHRTRAGDAELKRLRTDYCKLKDQANLRDDATSFSDIAVAAALFGLPAVAVGELAPIADAWKYRDGPPTTGSSGGGGMACSGGGGGGCGGGGCGGCGS